MAKCQPYYHDGTENFASWCNRFFAVSDRNHWDESRQLAELEDNLRGRAIDEWWDLSDTYKGSIKRAIGALQEAFGSYIKQKTAAEHGLNSIRPIYGNSFDNESAWAHLMDPVTQLVEENQRLLEEQRQYLIECGRSEFDGSDQFPSNGHQHNIASESDTVYSRYQQNHATIQPSQACREPEQQVQTPRQVQSRCASATCKNGKYPYPSTNAYHRDTPCQLMDPWNERTTLENVLALPENEQFGSKHFVHRSNFLFKAHPTKRIRPALKKEGVAAPQRVDNCKYEPHNRGVEATALLRRHSDKNKDIELCAKASKSQQYLAAQAVIMIRTPALSTTASYNITQVSHAWKVCGQKSCCTVTFAEVATTCTRMSLRKIPIKEPRAMADDMVSFDGCKMAVIAEKDDKQWKTVKDIEPLHLQEFVTNPFAPESQSWSIASIEANVHEPRIKGMSKTSVNDFAPTTHITNRSGQDYNCLAFYENRSSTPFSLLCEAISDLGTLISVWKKPHVPKPLLLGRTNIEYNKVQSANNCNSQEHDHPKESFRVQPRIFDNWSLALRLIQLHGLSVTCVIQLRSNRQRSNTYKKGKKIIRRTTRSVPSMERSLCMNRDKSWRRTFLHYSGERLKHHLPDNVAQGKPKKVILQKRLPYRLQNWPIIHGSQRKTNGMVILAATRCCQDSAISEYIQRLSSRKMSMLPKYWMCMWNNWRQALAKTGEPFDPGGCSH